MTSPITKLPDGSACFTAEIMSKEEAMKLPLEKRPLNYRISSEMYMAVWDAIAVATHLRDDPEKVSDVVVKLCFKIAEELEKSK